MTFAVALDNASRESSCDPRETHISFPMFFMLLRSDAKITDIPASSTLQARREKARGQVSISCLSRERAVCQWKGSSAARHG